MSIAWCVYHPDSDPFNGFIGPFKVTPTGVQLHFLALFYDTATRKKDVVDVIADIPDGSSLAQVGQLSANAAKAAGAQYGYAVTNVLLPQIVNVVPQ